MNEYRAFVPERDANPLLQSRYLAAGERISWISLEGVQHYLVTGREPKGGARPKRESTWWLLLKIMLVPIWWPLRWAFWVFAENGDRLFPPWTARPKPPRSIAFGSQLDCMAVRALRDRTWAKGAGVWLLTDRRFARLTFDRDPKLGGQVFSRGEARTATLPREPVNLTVDLEIPASQVRFEPNLERRLPKDFDPRAAVYHRITLPDGSGFDICADPVESG
ncbi:hypothetical protein [Glycomyces sp. NPDC021274]|uniref:hypothetical protein n=1 Tax=Glycomyces sp. NPDC021274 TaxID=3155120 RepID=UPI0033D5B3E3